MKLRKGLLVGLLVAGLCLGIPAAQVLGAEPPPGEDEKIIGPTMWAVGVIDCTGTCYATLRVKKVEGCDVDTHSQVGAGTDLGITGTPNETDVLYARLPLGSVFGLPCVPIITKVKNFKNEGSIVSFDAQIQFVVPSTYAGTECQ